MVEKLVQYGFATVASSEAMRRNVEDTFIEARAFFRMNLSEKMANRLPHDSGYRPFRGEYSSSPEHPDEVESFSVSYRVEIPVSAPLSGQGLRLHERMLALYDSLEPLAEAITIALADRFGVQPSDKFRGAFHLSSILQLNYSRPSETAADFINELHEDGCLLTITSVTAPGLEVQNADGSFLPMTPSGGELLIMSSEILSLITGRAIRPVFHRVRPTPDFAERMSLLFFADPHPKLCDPWVLNETNANVDIGERVLTNATRFGLSEWKLDQFT